MGCPGFDPTHCCSNCRRGGRIHCQAVQGGELGEQLDSLADAVSFGVAPALLIYLQFGQVNPLVGEPDPLIAVFPVFFMLSAGGF